MVLKIAIFQKNDRNLIGKIMHCEQVRTDSENKIDCKYNALWCKVKMSQTFQVQIIREVKIEFRVNDLVPLC